MSDESFAELMRKGEVPLSPPAASSPAASRTTAPATVLPLFRDWQDVDDAIAHIYRRDSVSAQQARRAFKTPPQDQINLHNKTREQAHTALDRFLCCAIARQLRVVEIIPGKGLHSAGGAPLLRPHTRQWLQQCSWVLAYQSPHHNSGTILVLLKANS